MGGVPAGRRSYTAPVDTPQRAVPGAQMKFLRGRVGRVAATAMAVAVAVAAAAPVGEWVDNKRQELRSNALAFERDMRAAVELPHYMAAQSFGEMFPQRR